MDDVVSRSFRLFSFHEEMLLAVLDDDGVLLMIGGPLLICLYIYLFLDFHFSFFGFISFATLMRCHTMRCYDDAENANAILS